MNEAERIEGILRHLMAEARQRFGASRFTIIAGRFPRRVSLRFEPPPDTPVTLPSDPDGDLCAAGWQHRSAEVMSDNFDDLHMTWSWNAEEEPDRARLTRFAADYARETNTAIEVR